MGPKRGSKKQPPARGSGGGSKELAHDSDGENGWVEPGLNTGWTMYLVVG